MARLVLDRVAVEIPVYGARGYSLKQALAAAATGGRLGRDANVAVVQALADICLDLRDGDRLGITGHNGAGKTTLLRTMAGAYPPTRGTCTIEGSVSSLLDPMLGIEPDATGYENIVMRGLLGGMSGADSRRLVPEIAEFSGLGDFLSMPVRTYSSGMTMRLAFSIATAVHSDILLMDEWLAVGDAAFQQVAEARLAALVEKSGILVLASHNLGLIERECTRAIELVHGTIHRVWTPGASAADLRPLAATP